MAAFNIAMETMDVMACGRDVKLGALYNATTLQLLDISPWNEESIRHGEI